LLEDDCKTVASTLKYTAETIKACDDGTLRDANNNCWTTANDNGTGLLYTRACQFYPSVPDKQKWNLEA